MFKLENQSNYEIENHSGIMVKPKESQPTSEKLSGDPTFVNPHRTGRPSSAMTVISISLFNLFLLIAC